MPAMHASAKFKDSNVIPPHVDMKEYLHCYLVLTIPHSFDDAVITTCRNLVLSVIPSQIKRG